MTATKGYTDDLPVASDGRVARRERGRVAVLDAAIDLIAATGSVPTMAAIAEQAGVSSATIFRYFDSADDLQHEATLRHFERNRELFELPGTGIGPLGQRIQDLASARVRLHSAVAPVARFGRSRMLAVPYVADGIRAVRRMHADQIRRHFAAELDDLAEPEAERVVLAIATLTCFESWEQLHSDFSLSNNSIQDLWVAAMGALVTKNRPT